MTGVIRGNTKEVKDQPARVARAMSSPELTVFRTGEAVPILNLRGDLEGAEEVSGLEESGTFPELHVEDPPYSRFTTEEAKDEASPEKDEAPAEKDEESCCTCGHKKSERVQKTMSARDSQKADVGRLRSDGTNFEAVRSNRSARSRATQRTKSLSRETFVSGKRNTIDSEFRRRQSSRPAEAAVEFEVHEVWMECQPVMHYTPSQRCAMGVDTASSSVLFGARVSMIIPPKSILRSVLDVVSLLTLFYETFAIPFSFLDFPTRPSMFLTMNWVTRLYWTVDMGLCCMSGYIRNNGTVEMRWRQVIWRYLTTWFLVDLLIVVSDWASVWVMENARKEGSMSEMQGAARSARVGRMARLLRLAKLPAVAESMLERLRSEKLSLVGKISKIILFIIGLSHIIGCAWHIIGSMEDGWLEAHGLEDADMWYQYMTSVHYGVTQFIGTMGIEPQNTGERCFAVCMCLLGLVVSASFVSALTSSLTDLHMVHGQWEMKIGALRRYLWDYSISHQLSVRVLRNARHVSQQKHMRFQENGVELLQQISLQLRMELRLEINSPHLMNHPFFLRYIQENIASMRHISYTAVSSCCLSKGDVLFSREEVFQTPKMYFVCKGSLRYATDDSFEDISEGTWICEHHLWTEWSTVGTMQAREEILLLSLDAEQFQIASCQSTCLDFQPALYAQAFVERLNGNLEELSDIGSVDMAESLVEHVYGQKKPGLMYFGSRQFMRKGEKKFRRSKSFGNYR
eukprot:TRINITY_DN6861_c0_g2_i2.p1 TRINITY_DN6861_c0_g2~~TRINITY_DN6861_c0_g2_i2.p1  ORF type:complete len:866 (-),score=142.76 TRINITY_DN6861_c0_g2_i2:81-2306(-)